MTLIGLTGRKGSGKSTVANYLASTYGFIEISIATPLKQICEILGVPKEALYGSQKDKERYIPEIGMSGREVMQRVGTELFRNNFSTALPNFKLNAPTIWVHIFKKFLKDNVGKNIVISDCRFQDEISAINDMNGHIIYIERRRDGPVDSHESESMMIDYDIMIDNTKDCQYLYDQVDNIVKKLL